MGSLKNVLDNTLEKALRDLKIDFGNLSDMFSRLFKMI